MEDHPLQSTTTSGVLVLTMNRPARRNALSPLMYDALLDALTAAGTRSDIGAIVLTGAGGAFCAGGDVARMAGSDGTREPEAMTFEGRVARLRRRTRIVELLHTLPIPSIAMMRGPAVGAGLSLALACDMRLADSTARMMTGFVKVGVPGDFGGHYFLPRIVGMARARSLYLTSPMLDAQQALAIGLVDQVHAADALAPAVMTIASQWARGPRTALRYIKENLNGAMHATLAEVLDNESWRHARSVETADHKEATSAFMQKRSPQFANDDRQ